MTDADALVVGAGPAGATAALMLARAGIRVLLVDRARFPRHKLCGDTLNPGALTILDGIGRAAPASGDGGLMAAVRARALPIVGMTVTGPAGERVTADYPHGLRGAAIGRADLDVLLLEAAIRAGVMFEDGLHAQGAPGAGDGAGVTAVRVASAGRERTLRARIVIAADGRASRLAAALKLSAFASRPRRWAYGAYFAGVDGLDARGEMHIRADGYIGVAPLPGGLANVCVVREAGTGAMRNAIGAGLTIGAALASDPLLRDRFARARQVSGLSILGPLAVDARAAGCPGLLLAGDAAGFVDPMTGDGLRFALRGGMLAADAALAELESGRPAHVWLHAARAREFSRKYRINRALRALVGSPRAVAIAGLVAGCWAAPVRHLVAVAGDVAIAANGAGRDPLCAAAGRADR